MNVVRNVSESVLAKLRNKAKQDGTELQQLITRYGLERMLYRLSQSEFADSFLLKGAMLFNLWFDMPHRPTTDVDMLGYGDYGLEQLTGIFKQVCSLSYQDGIVFDPDTVHAQEIRKDANYAGVRVTFTGSIGRVRCPIQVDVGYGDAVTPKALNVEYPVLLSEMPYPALRAYPKDTVVAEKTEAMIKLAMANTRMKDYFDLWVLSEHAEFDGGVLLQAVEATFRRRGTAIDMHPLGLSDEFANDENKLKQWTAFIRKNRLEAPTLPGVIRQLKAFLLPVLSNVAEKSALSDRWTAGGPWQKLQEH